MKISKLHKYDDPGHGWVKTTYQTLEILGIEGNISHYSYRQGNTVWLEEDCDAPVLIRTLKGLGNKVEIIPHLRDSQSPIRYKDPYYQSSELDTKCED